MFGRFRPTFGMSPRRAILAVLAAAHFLLSSGVPLPTVRPIKSADRPFPCMDKPCGCVTYEKCWEGDCCCFTLAEKFAWVKARNLPAPATAVHAAEPDCAHCPPKPKPCCTEAEGDCGTGPKPPSVCAHRSESPAFPVTVGAGLIVGLFVQKCHGEAFAGVGLLPVAVPPEPAFVFELETPVTLRVPLTDHVPTARPTPPDAPPPRHV